MGMRHSAPNLPHAWLRWPGTRFHARAQTANTECADARSHTEKNGGGYNHCLAERLMEDTMRTPPRLAGGSR
eukprot:6820442-Lingulodinium_polyedra.AAC.1